MDSLYDNIPPELKAHPHWVCGRVDKAPINPKTGCLAQANDPRSWASFDEAVKYREDHNNNGIKTVGFEASKAEESKDPFSFYDLDHCRNVETGEIEPWALEIIETIDSYTEASPSGTGIRIAVTCDLPPVNRKKGGIGISGKSSIEIANHGKYFSVTGNHLEGTPTHIGYRPGETRTVYEKYFAPKAEPKEKPTPGPSITDEELLKKAFSANNGGKFKTLWAGDYRGYPSHSEADQALCNHLAFWTGNDASRIDSLFKQSGLMRVKWERDDYRSQTIARAIETTKETYHEKKDESQPPRREETLIFPPDIMSGVAGHFADAYGDITEAPKPFYYICYLVCLGSYLSGKISLNTLLNVQPRLYVILLGPSGRGRKSTPITITTDFFHEIFEDFSIMHHAGSGEGLGVHLEKKRNTLLCYDEFLGFVSKAMQKGNTLLGTVTTLFEKNAYQTATKDKQLIINDAHLAMVGACTIDTWQRCWEADFTAIGLNNRLFLVPGVMEKYVSLPPRLEVELWKLLRDELRQCISKALSTREYVLTQEAFALYDEWYRETLDHKSIHSVRLDQYALRFMLLFAVNESKAKIDVPIVKAVIELVEWQHKVRQQYDPIDVDNESAKIETRIRRVLTSWGSLTKRELQQKTGAARSGKWLWNTALENLTKDEEVRFNQKGKYYTLVTE
jgi:hypothetical protein